jgi:V/A-type H+/Na+-transporting ATPase subunit I
MRWREAMAPPAMSRVAVVARTTSLRDALVRLADAGTVELDRVVSPADLPVSDATRALQRSGGANGHIEARLAVQSPDLLAWEQGGRVDLLAGEDQLTEHRAQAITRGELAALAGWTPTASLPDLAGRLAEVGAAVVELDRPRGVEPPTAAATGRTRRAFAPLVDTYATIPYVDVDPTMLAGLSYAVMFGAMFGDVGDGILLVVLALLVRAGRPRRLASLRPHWIFLAAAGVAAALFGFAYGEFFGPTGLVPAGLVAPLEQPVAMLVAGVALGAILLGGAYALGTVNRIREGGWVHALYAPAGLAGSLLFVAAGLAVAAWFWHSGWTAVVAALLAVIGLTLTYAGLFVAAGGGGSGVVQAAIEVFDLVIRLGANVVSFTRLAAFGLTHAVLAWIVWQATVGLWGRGPAAAVGAVAVFVVGHAVTFGLEALVAGIQALRLEYYELFSRVFQLEGRPFRPWHVPMDTADPREAPCCPPGSSAYQLSPAVASPR